MYFGGGTPSLIGPDNLFKILDQLSISSNTEVTLETNPEDVNKEKFREFRQAGVNRVSMGVQSFDDEDLKILQRTHNAKKALESIEDIYSSGIENISIDLMYDLPFQKVKIFEKSLKTIQRLPIKHLSLYNLTFEENTPFFKNYNRYKPFLPSNEESLFMLNKAISYLKSLGFERYEISAFAKERAFSLHNLGYWIGREFFGFGPSAFSFVGGKRYQNVPNVKDYLNLVHKEESAVIFEEKLSSQAGIRELLAINLRIIEGVDIDLFQKEFGILSEEVVFILTNLVKDGFLLKKKSNFQLTSKGLLFYDLVAEKIVL